MHGSRRLGRGGPVAIEHRDWVVVAGDGHVDRGLEELGFGAEGEFDAGHGHVGGGGD